MGTGVILSRKVTYARDPSFSKPEFIPSPLSPSLSKLYGSSFQKKHQGKRKGATGRGILEKEGEVVVLWRGLLHCDGAERKTILGSLGFILEWT